MIGLYFVAVGIGLFVERDEFSKLVKELTTQPMLGYVGGIIAFAIGGVIIAVHNDWSSFLSGFISLIGWMALGEGVLMLACRRRFLGFFERMTLSAGVVAGFGLATSIVGVILILAAFVG